MIKFIKNEFGPYFKDLNDYDFRFFRTLIEVIKNPNQVIETNDGTYTPELKFLLTIITTLFLFLYFIEPSWIESISPYALWRYPLVHQQYLKTQLSVEQNYTAYFNAMAIAPLMFILMKLFFYNKKPWGFFLSASFYLSPLIITIVSVGDILVYYVGDFDQVISVLMIVLLIYPIASLRLQSWWISIIKSFFIVAIPLVLLEFSAGTKLPDMVSQSISSRIVFDMKPSNESLIHDSFVESDFDPNVTEMYNKNSFVSAGYWFGLQVENGELVWEHILYDYYEFTGIKYFPLNKVTLFTYQDEDSLHLFQYDRSGEEVFNYVINRTKAATDLSLIKESPGQIEFFIRNMTSTQILTKKSEGWVLSAGNQIEVEYLKSIHQTSTGFLGTRVVRPEKHISSMSIIWMDSTLKQEKTFEVYRKNTLYDPLDELEIDLSQESIYAHYCNASDSNYTSYAYSIDIESGVLNWQNTFEIPANIFEYSGIQVDKDYLYIYGEGHKLFAKPIWQPTYHVGLIVKLSRQNGQYLNHLFIGPNKGTRDHSRISGVYVKSDTIFFVAADRKNSPIMDDFTEELRIKGLLQDF